MLPSLRIERYQRIVILTGAGVSVASGLRPFRGPGGLWQDESKVVLSTAKAFAERPADVWELFGTMRQQAASAVPNAAHHAFAELERRHSTATVTIVTQNIDGLHQRAGSTNVIELHGSVFRTRCSNESCDLPMFADPDPRLDAPSCARCGKLLRPDVVLFDEPISVDAEWQTKKALRDCDFFMAVGTSGTVTPASNFVRSAEYARARTVLVNLEPMNPRNPAYDEEYLGKAEEILPRLLVIDPVG